MPKVAQASDYTSLPVGIQTGICCGLHSQYSSLQPTEIKTHKKMIFSMHYIATGNKTLHGETLSSLIMQKIMISQ